MTSSPYKINNSSLSTDTKTRRSSINISKDTSNLYDLGCRGSETRSALARAHAYTHMQRSTHARRGVARGTPTVKTCTTCQTPPLFLCKRTIIVMYRCRCKRTARDGQTGRRAGGRAGGRAVTRTCNVYPSWIARIVGLITQIVRTDRANRSNGSREPSEQLRESSEGSRESTAHTRTCFSRHATVTDRANRQTVVVVVVVVATHSLLSYICTRRRRRRRRPVTYSTALAPATVCARSHRPPSPCRGSGTRAASVCRTSPPSAPARRAAASRSRGTAGT